MFISACGITSHQTCPDPRIHLKSKYSSAEEFKSIAKDNSKELYLLFGAEWCPHCVSLQSRLKDAGISHRVILLNIDETWAFLLSRKLQIKSVPALAVISTDSVPIIRLGSDRILVYLLANVETR